MDKDISTLERGLTGGWSLAMGIVPLGAGNLLVYSPTWLGDDTFDRVDALGKVRVLVAPNHFHHLSLDRFRKRYPEARAVASPTALVRLQKKGHRGLLTPDDVRSELPDEIALLACEGTKAGELWVTRRKAGETTWIVGDAFFHVNRPLSGAFSLFARLTRTGPGLCIGQTFRWLALRDEGAYRAWLLDQLAREPPTAVHFCHGELLAGPDVAKRLAEIAELRLRAG